MSEWKRVTLGEICEASGGGIQTGPFGSQLHASDYVNEGIPSVMPQNIGDNRIDPTGIAMVSESDVQRLSRYKLSEGDIVYSRRGDVERRALIREENQGWLCGTGCLRVRFGRRADYDPRFVSYALGLDQVRTWIRQHAVGATMLNLNTSILSSVPLDIPGVMEQRAIAEVLGALDDKIAANDRAQGIVAELSRSLFDRAAKSGTRNIVSDVTELVTRGITPRYTEDDGITVLNQKCVRDQRVSLEQARTTSQASVRENKLLRLHDVLVNSTGFGTLGRAARWTRDIEATVDSHISIVRFDANKVDPVCAGFGLVRLEKQIESLAEGSTGQTELRRDLLASLEILVPCKEEQQALGEKLAKLDAHALVLENENQKLANTRDSLLPLLMSGKVRVRDAEKAVEEVV